ncbi:SymE family type I addiction module toxin [Arsenophonus sp. aPb]|uniref:SymE family type I addiction module toxin n=1 Tax=Arsenophonus sp. aPb TaxID=3041619 RepID=UPI002469A641|nr:SymE family type I addiction module toxin [Arsenophonus sp. aPb]WGL99516.1 SymE family type I addiction module toxin [Arsenophonus sp. aPb]
MATCNCKVKPLTVTVAAAKSRRYTVGYLPNKRKPNPSPQMIISGKWLSELGFHIGSHFTINRQAGELVIQLVENN